MLSEKRPHLSGDRRGRVVPYRGDRVKVDPEDLCWFLTNCQHLTILTHNKATRQFHGFKTSCWQQARTMVTQTGSNDWDQGPGAWVLSWREGWGTALGRGSVPVISLLFGQSQDT